MSVSLKAKVTRNRYSELLRQARASAERRNEELAKDTVEIAKQLVPVSDNADSGHVHLRDTIRVEKNRRTGLASAIAGDVERGVDYAQYVELGTVHMAARPYMRPASEQAAKRAQKRRVSLYRG